MFSHATHNSRVQPVAPVPGRDEVIDRVNELIADLKPDNADLLKALHRIQHEYGYVPRVAVPLLAGKFETTPAIVFGTIDFYSEVHLEPSAAAQADPEAARDRGIYGKLEVHLPAENIVGWCSGPACLLKGSMQIRGVLESILGCEMNQATDDGKFELRLVQCDGTCHLAPLIRHKGKYIGPLTTSDTIAFARNLKGEPSLEERMAAGQAASTEEETEGSAE